MGCGVWGLLEVLVNCTALHALQYTLATIAHAALVQHPYQLVLGTTTGSKEEPTDQPTNKPTSLTHGWLMA